MEPIARRSLLSMATTGTALAMVGSAAQPAHAGETNGQCNRPVTGGTATDLGTPITTALSPDQAIGEGLDGEPLAFFFPRGNDETPSEFAVFDIRSEQTIFSARVPRGKDGWAVEYSATEQAVYFGITNGQGDLYRYRVGSDTIEELGVPIAGEQVWALAAAPDGVIYGGTYPNGHVFSFDPQTGQLEDFGQTLGQPYVRSLEVTDTVVWAGTQGVGRLAEINRSTGATTEIQLPDGFRDRQAVYDLFHVRADRLVVRTESGPETAIHFFDLDTRTFIDTVEEAGARQVSSVDPATNQHVYFRVTDGEHSGQIVRYDLETSSYEPTGWAPNIITGDFRWVDMADPQFPDLSLAVTYYYMRVDVYNPQTEADRSMRVEVQGAPVRLASLGAGPDGRIYVSGQGDQARWDPRTSSIDDLSGGNTQGYGSWGDKLLLGKYPSGGLQVYDTTSPWDPAAGNPTESLRIGEQQDRPIAFAELPDVVVVGSAPESGELGGAVTLWNPDTGELRVHRNVVPDQSVVSLVYDGELVWGGTSIQGGYGADPTATEAKLFAFDLETEEVVFETSVVDNATTIAPLRLHDGVVWGNADGTLFAFDPGKRATLGTIHLAQDTLQRHGRNRGIVFDQCGRMLAVSAYKLYFINQQAWKARELADDQAEALAIDADGELYYRSGANLIRFTPR